MIGLILANPKSIYLKDIENVMEAVLQVLWELIGADLPVFTGLAVWNLFAFSISQKRYTNLL